jgi:hypothetical protein
LFPYGEKIVRLVCSGSESSVFLLKKQIKGFS